MQRIPFAINTPSHSCSDWIRKMAPTTLTSRFERAVTSDALRSYLAEFISTFFFVFAVVGSAMSSRKLMPDMAPDPSSLVIVAIATAFALSSAMYITANISGGHVNPAVTFAMAVGGHLSVPTALFYWISQMLASVIACLLLRVITVEQHIPTYTIAAGMTGFGASVLEGVLTFGLVYTVYICGGLRRGPQGANGSLAIGFIAGANVLAAGPFSGAAMNPICAFGPAVIAGSFKNHAVYWVGPLVGGAVAGLLHDNVASPSQDPDSIRGVSLSQGGVTI